MKTRLHIASPPWGKVLLAATLVLAGWPGRAGTAAATNQPPAATRAAAPHNVRQPAVAGLFYPKDPKALANTVDQCLAAAPPR